MTFSADLHVHSHFSADSPLSLRQIAAAARRREVHAVAVCDHNNCRSHGEIAAMADMQGLIDGVLFIPGVEYSTRHGHILGLFLKRPVAQEEVGAPEGGVYDTLRVLAAIHSAGGLCSVAHPFRLAGDRRAEELMPLREVDCVECFNARVAARRPLGNREALEMAQSFQKGFTAGSDAHTAPEVGGGRVVLPAASLTLDALEAALCTQMGGISGRPGPCRCQAYSQLYKAIQKKTWRKLPRRLAVLGLFALRDLFTNRRETTIVKEGEWHVRTGKDS